MQGELLAGAVLGSLLGLCTSPRGAWGRALSRPWAPALTDKVTTAPWTNSHPQGLPLPGPGTMLTHEHCL